MPIQWTKEARALLPPPRLEAKLALAKYDASKLATDLASALDVERPKFERGVKKKLGDVALVSEVLAFYTHFDPSLPLDPKTDARLHGAMVTMFRGWGHQHVELARALLRHWIARGGLAFAVRAQWNVGLLNVVHGKKAGLASSIDMDISSLKLEGLGGWSLWGLRPDELRAELAHPILAASEAEYREVVATVAELRAESKVASMRCDLSSLVPTETAAARKDVSDVLAQTKKPLGGETLTTGFCFPALGRSPEAIALLEELTTNAYVLARGVMDAVFALEDDAVAPLAKIVTAWRDAPPKANMGLAQARVVARALALFDDDRAAKAFALWVGDTKALGPIAVEYMQRFPARAVEVLSPRLLEKTKGAEPAQQLLARIARAHGDEVRAASQHATKEIRAALEAMAATSTQGIGGGEAATADASEVPEILRDPPWRKKTNRPAIPVVDKLRAASHDERIAWPDEATRHAATQVPWGEDRPALKAAEIEKLASDLARLVSQGEHDTPVYQRRSIAWRTIGAAALPIWNDVPPWARQISEASFFSEVACMLARFGVDAIPGAVASALASSSERAFDALAYCDSPRVAPAMLRAFGRGALRRTAIRWAHAFPTAAALGLLPIALSAPSRDKMDALSAIRSHVAREVVEKTAPRLGDEAAAAVRAIYEFDPLWDCPKSAPKLSAFADPSTVPAIRLKNGRVLGDDAKRNLLEMLQFTQLDHPYAGVAPVVAALDRGSLDDALRSLLDAWVAAGAQTVSAWPLRAIAHAGSDAMVRELAAKIRKWPREKGRPRALLGVEVLGAMGSDIALMHLFDLSKTSKNRHVEARATQVLADAAAARGLSGDALEDRLVPTLDLAPDGTTTLDFGPRTFTVRVDEHFAPVVFEGGARVASLPRAKKEDDAIKAKAATTRFKTLKSDLETLAKTLLFRFEHAMVTGRSWDAREQRALIVDHPLAGRVARKLVWARLDDGKLAGTFRVAEDGSFADDADAAVTLGEDARVSVVHPLMLDEKTRARWTALFADYAIIPPFDQIARATFSVDAKTKSKKEIDAFSKREIPYGVLFGRLESRGWRRGSIDDGSISTLEKDFGAASATLSFSPALFVREKPPSAMTIDDVTFGGASLGALPAIVYSEAMFDLHVFAPRV